MNRRNFLTMLGLAGAGAMLPSRLRAMGDASKVTIARLGYGADAAKLRPSAIRRLLQEAEKRTSIAVETDYPTISPTSKKLFEHPFVAMTGDEEFDALPVEAVKRLRTYLQSGGFLFIDSAEGITDGPFSKSVERELERMFPEKSLSPIPSDHVLYKAFYLIDDPVGRIDIADKMHAIFDSDRLYAVVNYNDLFGALARDNFGEWKYTVRPGGEQQREMAFRMGINLLMYAMCVNYKSDQVHVPFILKRRNWKVD